MHISDLHLGKRVNEYSMLDDQAYILDEILRIAKEEEVQGVLIAGDVYDRPVPPSGAVRILDDLLDQFADRNVPVFFISGNHDSRERLAFGAALFEKSGVYMAGEELCKKIRWKDEYGELNIWLMPFLKPAEVRMVYWDGVFNYSAINNYGASFAKGEYLLLLNNDTEIINSDCLEELLGYCMRKDVGAVGARLYYEDDTIQHAGVVIGFGGIAGHCFVQQKRGTTGYCHRIICAQDYSVVTAACMMVKKSAFDAVGGLSEELAVAFNDIDFCMKLRKAGYLIVYNPYAELYHYESKSRGLEDTPEKVARFNKEIATFEKKWPEILKNGDPYYNPNLTLKSQDFSLKRI